jgi:hypothetical protein
MRTTTLALMVSGLLMGCATAPKQQARGPMPSEKNDSAVATQEAAKPNELGGSAVKIVAHKPSPAKYKYVGRIEARAHSSDIVDAAIAVDADLRRQAKALGADVVKVDAITTPAKKGNIVLAGRAYKKSS